MDVVKFTTADGNTYVLKARDSNTCPACAFRGEDNCGDIPRCSLGNVWVKEEKPE